MDNPVLSEPVNLGSEINDTSDAYINAIRLDDSLLFYTRRFKPADFERHGRCNENFFVSKRNETGWGAATNETGLAAYPQYWGHFHFDGLTMFFTACGWPDGYGSCDLYVSYFNNGKWNSPRNLGAAINLAQWESQPAISADGNELYFASQRSRGGQGDRISGRA